MNLKTTLGAFALMTVVAMGATAPASGAETTSTVPRLATAHSTGTDGSLSSGQVLLGSGNSHFNGNPVTIQTTNSGSLYSLNDPTRPGLSCGPLNGPVFTKTTDTWGNGTGTSLETACVDVMFAAQKHWDMLRDWLGRNGVDGAGRFYPASVGLNNVNAYWDGTRAVFGHNSAHTKQLTSLDVVGYQYGLAVYEMSGSDDGNGAEARDLNKSAADIFGTLTEHYVNHPLALDEPDYLIGEEVNTVGTGPLIHMYNPSLTGQQNCYGSLLPPYYGGPQDHWFYLLAEGTNPPGKPASPVCAGPSSLTGIGIQKAARIFYLGLQRKSLGWSYGRARVATMQAAKNLYGCPEMNATKAAWTAIRVPGQVGEPTCSMPTPTPSGAPSPTSPSGPSSSPSGITVDPPSARVGPGGSTTVQIKLSPGTPRQVPLSASGSPAGTAVSIIRDDQSTTAIINVSAGTPQGTYTITFVATSEDSAKTTHFTLIVAGDDD
ncbi:Thermolysin metallopeptidase, alpha-helical domain [Streptosporangium canum]|uniref:Thermolysin metallopeptidase, alpha-helical domain n=1 Tax=Streptosporangium canum TaxID=324952 RepID=A0A1I4BWJ2_9ACTN|nr:M4 family metallopeptidase [Streptosporangium canum]SFK72800.1 Thermolysin metallopeptidase, alpha-helical domain [Streptosporangium canum]